MSAFSGGGECQYFLGGWGVLELTDTILKYKYWFGSEFNNSLLWSSPSTVTLHIFHHIIEIDRE